MPEVVNAEGGQDITSTVWWGVTAPDEIAASRAALDLGLRRATLHYGELAVPGIGGVFFARQLVWPCLALALSDRLSVRPAVLATTIEALASWVWHNGPGAAQVAEPSLRAPGRRRLPGRKGTYAVLGRAGGYVTNPLRRAATRALPEAGGLGFASGGATLATMALTQAGERLVEEALRAQVGVGGQPFGSWMEAWIKGGVEPKWQGRKKLLSAIGAETPTERERKVVLQRLLQTESRTPPGLDDPTRRCRLIKVLMPHLYDGIHDFERQVLAPLRQSGKGGAAHATALLACLAFQDVRDAAANALRACATAMADGATARPLAILLDNSAVYEQLERARDAAGSLRQVAKSGSPMLLHAEAATLISELLTNDGKAALAALLARDGDLLRLEGQIVSRGPAYRASPAATLGAVDEDGMDPQEVSTGQLAPDRMPPRLWNLISLLQDCVGVLESAP